MTGTIDPPPEGLRWRVVGLTPEDIEWMDAPLGPYRASIEPRIELRTPATYGRISNVAVPEAPAPRKRRLVRLWWALGACWRRLRAEWRGDYREA